MIDVKEAVKQAFQAMEHLFARDTFHDPRLEEVKLSKDEKHWFITLGFNVKEAPLKKHLTVSLKPWGQVSLSCANTRFSKLRRTRENLFL